MSQRSRRHRIENIKRSVRRSPNGRGVYLPGLRACRMAAGLTQRELAKAIGSSQGTIHELEKQARGAYATTVRRLCEALEVEPVDLICNDLDEYRKGVEL